MTTKQKQIQIDRFNRMTLMYMILGTKNGNYGMYYVRAMGKQQAKEAAKEHGIKIVELKLFTEFAADSSLDYIPQEMRPRKRKRKSKE